jgi:hypothetical protein
MLMQIQQFPLTRLPPDILSGVFGYFTNPKALSRIMLVSCLWRDIIQRDENDIYKNFLERDFKSEYDDRNKYRLFRSDWKNLYIIRYLHKSFHDKIPEFEEEMDKQLHQAHRNNRINGCLLVVNIANLCIFAANIGLLGGTAKSAFLSKFIESNPLATPTQALDAWSNLINQASNLNF